VESAVNLCRGFAQQVVAPRFARRGAASAETGVEQRLSGGRFQRQTGEVQDKNEIPLFLVYSAVASSTANS